jgi:hypothetical protein
MADSSGTETQPAPNISTQHQKDEDARSPSETLDQGQWASWSGRLLTPSCQHVSSRSYVTELVKGMIDELEPYPK